MGPLGPTGGGLHVTVYSFPDTGPFDGAEHVFQVQIERHARRSQPTKDHILKGVSPMDGGLGAPWHTEAADVCPVSTADICPVSEEDIYPV